MKRYDEILKKTILVVATLDTKGAEASYIKNLIEERGHKAIVMDIGIVGKTPLKPDISSTEVAGACKVKLRELVSSQRRDLSMKVMAEGAAKICRGLYETAKIDGVIGIGGNQGTMIGTFAMKTLPFGFPKVMVSTVASGNVRPYVGDKDIAMIFSVADLLGGVNMVTESILSVATGAIIGMCETGVKMSVRTGSNKTIGITAFGATHAAVTTALHLLKDMGYEVVAFHSSGAGGSALEELVAQGVISGVLDLTPHELVAEIFPDACDVYSPVNPGKFEAAVKKRIPLVVAPGGLDFFVYGSADTIPTQYRKRKIHYHNPNNVNVRVSERELKITGRVMAQRLNKAKGPVAVLIPLRGWTERDKKGGDLYDPVADKAFVASLKKHANMKIKIIEVDCHMNDPIFAKTAVDILSRMMQTHYY